MFRQLSSAEELYWSTFSSLRNPLDKLTRMNWQQVAPGVILLLVKVTGTSLFFVFLPQIFPMGNITFTSKENYSGWTPSPEQTSSLSPLLPTTAQIPLTQPRWERFRGNDYWFSEEKETWLISKATCRDWQSDLVIISDRKELLSHQTSNNE
ncbi:C-type lectin domain family 5 member A-like [Python bivittatus]|uniref:C-type lectin domain family 5 member A-like n=1 Tax=Python bivittatus TaxID=176946 RepID=A0A9F2WIM0_PYTBI|nr:C-type lectin domain family 5 member A-like [Python bivittatus]